MSWNGVSHIFNRYQYRFTGSEYLSINDSDSLDITGSFSLGIMLRPEPSLRLNYVLFCKGHPSDPTQGSFFIESVNGFLRVYLHCSSLSNSLVYDSVNPILNTNQIIYLEIVWDYTLKQLKIYRNSIETPISINTSSLDYFTAPSQMGLITENNEALLFSKATGKAPFIGTVYDYIYLSRARTSSEIFTYYESIKYTGSYPNTGKIVFSSDRFGPGYQLGIMNGDTTDPEPLFSLPTNIIHPRWRADGERLLFLYNTSSNLSSVNILTNDGTGTNGLGTITKIGGDYRTIYSPNSNNGVANYSKNSQNIIYLAATNSFSTSSGSAQISSYFDQTSSVLHANYVTRTGGYGNAFLDTSPNYTVYTEQQHSGSGQRVLRTDSDYPFGASLLIDSNTSGQKYGALRISNNEQKIVYTKIINTFRQVFICNIDGSQKTQLTFDAANHEVCCFSPDDTKIIYTSNITGTWQLYVMNSDGSNKINISNNSYNDRYADWKA